MLDLLGVPAFGMTLKQATTLIEALHLMPESAERERARQVVSDAWGPQFEAVGAIAEALDGRPLDEIAAELTDDRGEQARIIAALRAWRATAGDPRG